MHTHRLQWSGRSRGQDYAHHVKFTLISATQKTAHACYTSNAYAPTWLNLNALTHAHKNSRTHTCTHARTHTHAPVKKLTQNWTHSFSWLFCWQSPATLTKRRCLNVFVICVCVLCELRRSRTRGWGGSKLGKIARDNQIDMDGWVIGRAGKGVGVGANTNSPNRHWRPSFLRSHFCAVKILANLYSAKLRFGFIVKVRSEILSHPTPKTQCRMNEISRKFPHSREVCQNGLAGEGASQTRRKWGG